MLAKFGELLRAVAGGRDPAALPAPSELIPTIELGQPPIDWDYVRGVFHYGGRGTQAAVPAALSHVGLSNESPGAVAVVYAMSGRNGLEYVDLMMVQAVGTSWTGSGKEQGLDGRLGWGGADLRPSACQVRITANAGVFGDDIVALYPNERDSATNRCYDVVHPRIVLWPGQILFMRNPTVNEELRWNFFWYERQYDAEEIRGIPSGTISR